MATTKGTIGSAVIWEIVRHSFAATVILLMIPYVTGWLVYAAWFIFGWLCLGVLAALITMARAFNQIQAATRARRLR